MSKVGGYKSVLLLWCRVEAVVASPGDFLVMVVVAPFGLGKIRQCNRIKQGLVSNTYKVISKL